VNSIALIKTFSKVVELNSFSAAARFFKISVPAVSKQISLLEDSLGVELLTRTTRRISLTEVGHQYYQQCKNIMIAIDNAENLITSVRAKPMGSLKIKCPRYFSDKIIVPRLKAYMNEYPQVEIDLEVAERTPYLLEEELDIVVGMGLQNVDDSVKKEITTTRYVYCASPDYLKKHTIPQIPKDLIGHKYITHTMRMPNDILNFKNNEQIYIKPALYLNDSNAILNCAKEGIGIIKLHHYMVADALASGELIELLSTYQEKPTPIYLFYSPQKYLQPKVRSFIDFISQGVPEFM
jgi:DNA-binding transcriptional LysR family regulator